MYGHPSSPGRFPSAPLDLFPKGGPCTTHIKGTAWRDSAGTRMPCGDRPVRRGSVKRCAIEPLTAKTRVRTPLGPLDPRPFPLDQAHFAVPFPRRRLQILLHDGDHVPRQEGVEIDALLHRHGVRERFPRRSGKPEGRLFPGVVAHGRHSTATDRLR